MTFNIYIGGDKLDLYKDENVYLNSSVQNIQDITKIYTDYAQGITVPASATNNKIFKHWYNADITGGFSSHVRVDSTIELNHETFKTGKVQLNKVKLLNGTPKDYNITFYGNLVKLSDLFGNDLLSDLDLSAYDHNYTTANVKLGIESSLMSGSIIYPLISSERNWLWDTAGTTEEEQDIMYYAGTTYGVDYKELKPALKLTKIIEAIQTDYGITFSNDFFGELDFSLLYLWLSRDKGNIDAFSENVLAFSDVHFPGYGYLFTVTLSPDAGCENVPTMIVIESISSGDTVEFASDNGVNLGSGGADGEGNYNIYIAASGTYSGTVAYSIFKVYPHTSYSSDSDSISIIGGGININEQVPNMKIIDFVNGLFKAFNLAIVPNSEMDYYVDTLDNWYSVGSEIDITKYIDKEKLTIKRPELNKVIVFSYKEGKTMLNEQYHALFGDGYGDLDVSFTFDGGKLTNKLPFENLMHERLSSQLDGGLSDIHIAKCIDDELKPVKTAPIIFYNRAYTGANVGFSYVGSGTAVEITDYNNVGQENALISSAEGQENAVVVTRSLNWGSEISTWTLTEQAHSLYADYWQDYVTDLYDTQRRVYEYEGYLPNFLLTKIKLNDKLIIRDRKYIINKLKINLLTGNTKFELLNDV